MSWLMIDVAGTTLTAEDRELLARPEVAGVILFSRNYASYQQLTGLVEEMRQASPEPLLIAVDHEGGRVQRFRQEFSAIPAMSAFANSNLAVQQQLTAATEMGWLMASEVKSAGIDISFAPVLDIDAVSEVIGNRAFGADADTVLPLAKAFMDGMHQAGMATTGKHFPGHGSVAADSHIAIPVDERCYDDIVSTDMKVFAKLANVLDAVMPAHVIYPAVDDQPAGFSERWLQQELRQKLGFSGVIFSDDLSMQGATVVGDIGARAKAALAAGCDMLLLCNDRAAVKQLLATTSLRANEQSQQRLQKLYGQPASPLADLQRSSRWQQAQQWLNQLD
ncbi:beta-N-acetylhexosaminidase [Idiomarina tyrosinivorans]|uniref:Beta-hexosaminidase n=1 Tax=Idiomarina tyrosinivorans TaxID=1445662 RepID=A0A432ZRF9_9GAMM|nr:beta-N-acetylhexosaminidase [Idiomarina tyrosinivorans]RUO80490.1 beta-N-acetylhexosaminidase [Idiomarina tyrosinivorans]